ncbi:uncharacterized protein LOC125033991 isoform X1 [Penaeus chinensis]|uniref:uncharacterized protein LOC125033991 isoform X1 n=1 Tax=Penaeus chinensis TaxID=139456 RepID=UPI001FB5CFAA|nr:uncharacterized protein LOC125033991 isoform X1 [Penaeus chinensis]XP_047481563.1 uncharacterized protein LOC125033991 isoform X1 [Penaeus chinensis]
MRRRCPSPGAAQQVLLVSAVVMALTLYYRAPAIAVLHSAAPAARADQAPPPASTEAPRAKAAARKGGRTGIRAGWDDEAAADGDFPISLERDTGGDSFASKFMMALDFLTKEKERKTKATTHPPPRPSSDRSRTASTVPWNQDTGKETKHTEGTNPQPDTKANTIPAAKPAVSPGPQARACRVAFPPLDFCECKREILAQGGAACPATEGEGETTPRDLLAALNRTLGSSTCSDAATLRGANQSVISFSLFGAFPSEYHDGVPVVVARAAEAYPGWAVRVYHDLDLAKDLSARAWVCSLACKFPHLDFCSVGSLPGIGDLRPTIGTIWRMAVLGDPFVHRFVIRDTDSPILQREVDAVKEWVDSGKCFHIMRDNAAHTMPIMGGMFGGCGFWHREVLERIRGTLFRFSRKASHANYFDQVNEVRFLWPTLKKNFIAHDSYLCNQFPGSRPFPTKRVNCTFVGMRKYRKDFKGDTVKVPCPVACRPPKHRDWEYC